MAINRIFLSQLLGQVQEEVHAQIQAEQHANGIVTRSIHEQIARQSKAFEVHKERSQEQQKRRYEEIQIRRGKIRIFLDDAHGGRVSVGPIQISSENNLDEVQNRIWEWLQ